MATDVRKPAVLIVDDNEMNRVAFAALLDREYALRLAPSGADALELAAARDFAAILIDIRMPGLNGYETAERLRQQERTRRTPIIFLSADDQTPVAERCGYVAGATDFLFGLVNEQVLRFKVAGAVTQHLRETAVRSHIEDLSASVRTLRVDAARGTPAETTFRDALQKLEAATEELRRHLLSLPAGAE